MKTMLPIIIVFALAVSAHAQCPGGVCPVDYGWQPAQSQPAQQRASGWPDPRIVVLGGATGAFVQKDGKVFMVSCAHETARQNVRVGQRMEFVCNDGSRGVATVGQVDGNSDCSILTFPLKVGDHVKPFTVSTTPLRPGDDVWVVGFPMGRYRVRKTTVERDGDSLYLRGIGTPGESGGPIVNARGQLVGVLSSDEIHPHTGQSVGRTLCCGSRPIRQLLSNLLPNANVNYAKYGSSGGGYGYGPPQPPLVPVAPVQPPADDGLHSLLIEVEQRINARLDEINSCECNSPEAQQTLANTINVAVDQRLETLNLAALESELAKHREPIAVRTYNAKSGVYSDYQQIVSGDKRPGKGITITFHPEDSPVDKSNLAPLWKPQQ